MYNQNPFQSELPNGEAIIAIASHLDLKEGIDYKYHPNQSLFKCKEDSVAYCEETLQKFIDWIVQHDYPEEITNKHTGQVCYVKYGNKHLK